MGAVTRWFRLTKASASVSPRRIVLVFSTLIAGMLAFAAPASAATETFNYFGGAQTWIVPDGVTEATFDLYGAQGRGFPGDDRFNPGLGGRATATIAVTPGASIQVNVGGQGSAPAGGFNGGGAGAATTALSGGGGGGASDIRIGGTALTDRVLVAGGGGGAGGIACSPPNSSAGGDGGGESGQPGDDAGSCFAGSGGGGGTQTDGGTATAPATRGVLGVGGGGGTDPAEDACCGGGGGGGWYGGGGGVTGGGGGGSGHGPAGTVFQTGVRSGDGVVTITYTDTAPGIAALIRSVVDLNLPLGTEAALLRPLAAAALNFEAGRVARACNNLAAFVAQVKGESGTNIDPADADALVAAAEELRDSLNCGATGVVCAGQEVTIVGRDSAETLRGTNGDDVIAAKGGNDTVVGLRGDDIVCGGAGADVLRGQGGDDTLRGGRGTDVLRGGGGSNKCRGGGGTDSKRRC